MSDPSAEADDWLIRLMDMMADKDRPAAEREKLLAEFEQWQRASSDNLREIIERASLWYALGECERELIGNLKVLITADGNLIDAFDGKVLPRIERVK